MLYIILSVLAGVSIVLSRVINSNLSKKIGLFQGTFFNYLTGLSFSVIILVISKDGFNTNAIFSGNIPFQAYLGGFLGVLFVAFSSYITPKMSAFYLTLFTFVGQLLGGIVIDYFSLNILSMGKIIGGVLVLIGLSYNLFIDKKAESDVIAGTSSAE
ncbi:DMT family transporter [Clostridium sp. 'White wine YQ']|uniref:DMT family transporter n=1 Tax=Clostridium sp. 'White wine YQ' TaxID=3027474 RepID=UPI0023670D29|nr:DMT family transporter [Clostridium sp. 'White wine YQ']MDD7795306.1 DMT family transporter [Clostridium sp. 'White wine YQ']